MTRQRAPSSASNNSSVGGVHEQELDSMYDYLAKIILLGPSGSGKSCLLHRFVKNEWRVLTSQTIGVEFASKIVKVGSGARRKRIKLQLWDTAGTERFRSVSRSYYRGAAGALLVYDLTSAASFAALPTFLRDARALASPDLALVLVGNKLDLADGDTAAGANPTPPAHDDPDDWRASLIDAPPPAPATPSSIASSSLPRTGLARSISSSGGGGGGSGGGGTGLGALATASAAPEGRAVPPETASAWISSAASDDVPSSNGGVAAAATTAVVEASARTGEGVDEAFAKLASTILARIELGEVDPDDPRAGIQYGDAGMGGWADGGSVKSGVGGAGEDGVRRRRRRGTWVREWEEVFRRDAGGRRRRGGCC